MTSEYSPNVLTDGWDKYQVLIRFSDATPDANNNYHFVLQEPIKDVVHAEWSSASSGIVNSCLYINELNNDGQTTTRITSLTPPPPAPPLPPPPSWNDRFPVNKPALPTTSTQTTKFWRFVSDTNNYLSPSLADNLANPKTLYYLNIRVLNLDGTTKTPAGSDYLEIFFWYHRCCTK